MYVSESLLVFVERTDTMTRRPGVGSESEERESMKTNDGDVR